MELEISSDRPQAALTVILHFALDKPPEDLASIENEQSPPSVLKARRLLAQSNATIMQRGVNAHRSSRQALDHDVRVVTMWAWLEYLAEGYAAACTCYESNLQALRASSGAATLFEELLLQEYVRIVSFHVDQKAASSGQDLARLAESAVTRFPKNTAFLELYFSLGNAVAMNRSRWLLDLQIKRYGEAQKMALQVLDR